jgi:hypothetical protein
MATMTRGHEIMSDRYKFDFRECRARNGWAQLDTKQDASYFGNWINPVTLELVSYCEGDTTHTKCEDEADFIATVRECVRWHTEAGYFIGIDGMCEPSIIEAFTRMGMAELLH